MTDLTLLQKLSKRGTDFLGSTYPIIGGAMASISNHAWVSAVVNAGAFAFLSCGFLNPQQLEKEIDLTQQATSKSFGVNLIVLHPQIMDLIDVCIRKKVSHVILASGVPTADMIQRLKEGGVKVMTFAPTAAIGKRLIKNGIDALVNPKARDEEAAALVMHIAEVQRFDALLENQQVLREPIVRNGRKATVGYEPDVWKSWE